MGELALAANEWLVDKYCFVQIGEILMYEITSDKIQLPQIEERELQYYPIFESLQ